MEQINLWAWGSSEVSMVLELVDEALGALNDFISETGVVLSPDNVLFVHDNCLNYRDGEHQERITVRSEQLCRYREVPLVLGEVFTGDPFWIHANVIPTKTGDYIVSLICSAGLGNPHPQINISSELNQIVTIL